MTVQKCQEGAIRWDDRKVREDMESGKEENQQERKVKEREEGKG